MPDGSSISISPFSKAGVRKIVFNDLEDAEDYDLICVPATPEQVATIEKFFEDTEGDGYDWPANDRDWETSKLVTSYNRQY